MHYLLRFLSVFPSLTAFLRKVLSSFEHNAVAAKVASRTDVFILGSGERCSFGLKEPAAEGSEFPRVRRQGFRRGGLSFASCHASSVAFQQLSIPFIRSLCTCAASALATGIGWMREAPWGKLAVGICTAGATTEVLPVLLI